MTPLHEWERCKGWIESALEYAPFYTIDDILSEIEAGEAVLWPGKRSAVVTQFWDFPRTRGLNFWLAGGDLTELTEEMLPVMEAWGREQGCTVFFLAGRLGWNKSMKAKGYRPQWTILLKEAP